MREGLIDLDFNSLETFYLHIVKTTLILGKDFFLSFVLASTILCIFYILNKYMFKVNEKFLLGAVKS